MIAVRVKFLQSSGRIEWRQEVLRAVSSARGRNAAEGILSLEIQSDPPIFFAKCISFPTMGRFRKREKEKGLMMVMVVLVAAMMETRVSQ